MPFQNRCAPSARLNCVTPPSIVAAQRAGYARHVSL